MSGGEPFTDCLRSLLSRRAAPRSRRARFVLFHCGRRRDGDPVGLDLTLFRSSLVARLTLDVGRVCPMRRIDLSLPLPPRFVQDSLGIRTIRPLPTGAALALQPGLLARPCIKPRREGDELLSTQSLGRHNTSVASSSSVLPRELVRHPAERI